MGISGRSRKEAWPVALGERPAFRKLGFEISLIPDAQYPWPEDVIRQVRAIDPRIVPVFVRKAYLAPSGGTTIVGYNALARFNPNPHRQPIRPRSVLMATTGYARRFPYPTEMWWIFMHETDANDRPVRRAGTPSGGFVPWGDWLVRWVAANTQQTSPEQELDFIEKYGPGAVRTAQRNAVMAEAAARDKAEAPYRKRQFESMGVDDFRYAEAVAKHGPEPYEPKKTYSESRYKESA